MLLWAFSVSLSVQAGEKSPKLDPEAVERGRVAMTLKGHLKSAWSAEAYRKAGAFWKSSDDLPADYDSAFRLRYGLNVAPFSNDGLPMGLRRGVNSDGTLSGIQIDCLACHGGSIGGKSVIGLGNTTIDLRSMFDDLNKADGRPVPPSFFTINSVRGSVNAGMFSAVLLSLRNSDLSKRSFPIPLGANLPELDVPPWWNLAKKSSMYYDGRTPADSLRTNMQFLLGEKSLDDLKALEPTFRDIQAYLRSLKPPKYPFAIDEAKAVKGRLVFEKTCVKCHGTYGENGSYPNRIVELKTIGTDPARAIGLSDRLIEHYNSTWLGEDHPADEEMVGYQAPPLDGIWASAPYLHNGSVPNLHALLNSTERPSRFLRPPSTDFEHYDKARVGWKYVEADQKPNPSGSAYRAKFLYDTSRFGLGNGGHTFGDRLKEAERMELIEYLKTL